MITINWVENSSRIVSSCPQTRFRKNKQLSNLFSPVLYNNALMECSPEVCKEVTPLAVNQLADKYVNILDHCKINFTCIRSFSWWVIQRIIVNTTYRFLKHTNCARVMLLLYTRYLSLWMAVTWNNTIFCSATSVTNYRM